MTYRIRTLGQCYRHFDPCYRFPGRSHLMSFINDAIALIKLGIHQEKASAQKINFCADILSKKGFSSSYLEPTAHFYCPAKQSIKHTTLAVWVLLYPHTSLSACTSDIDSICNISFSCYFKLCFRTDPLFANLLIRITLQSNSF